MAARKSKRGGARKGAGRPKGTGTAVPRTQIAVSADQAARLGKWARANEMTVRDAADRAIDMVVQS